MRTLGGVMLMGVMSVVSSAGCSVEPGAQPERVQVIHRVTASPETQAAVQVTAWELRRVADRELSITGVYADGGDGPSLTLGMSGGAPAVAANDELTAVASWLLDDLRAERSAPIVRESGACALEALEVDAALASYYWNCKVRDPARPACADAAAWYGDAYNALLDCLGPMPADG